MTFVVATMDTRRHTCSINSPYFGGFWQKEDTVLIENQSKGLQVMVPGNEQTPLSEIGDEDLFVRLHKLEQGQRDGNKSEDLAAEIAAIEAELNSRPGFRLNRL